MKTCNQCGELKDLEAFSRKKNGKHGRAGQCKACCANYARSWYVANKDKQNAKSRAWYDANREKAAEYTRQYRQEKPHVMWASSYRTRISKFGLEPVVESFTREDLIAKYGDKCHHCGGEWSELDHFPTPIHEGGAHTLENTRPSCTECNAVSWSWRDEGAANTAGQLIGASRRVEHLESQLTYLAGAIASMAADGETDSTVFTSLAANYRTARDEHAAAKQAYADVLAGA